MVEQPHLDLEIAGPLDVQVALLRREIEIMRNEHGREREEDKLTHEQEVARLTKIIERLEALEKAYQRGIGGVAVIMFLGVAIGFLFSYGKLIFAPWAGK